jgi:hypothetical protein
VPKQLVRLFLSDKIPIYSLCWVAQFLACWVKVIYLFKIVVLRKKITILALFCCLSSIGLAQTITGKWKGVYSEGMMKYTIMLDFILNADSSYTVHSYTKLPDNKDIWVICDVYYQFFGKDSLYVEETRRVTPDEKILPACLQKMYLKIRERKKVFVLDGVWRNASGQKGCASGGNIYFSKKKTAP